MDLKKTSDDGRSENEKKTGFNLSKNAGNHESQTNSKFNLSKNKTDSIGLPATGPMVDLSKIEKSKTESKVATPNLTKQTEADEKKSSLNLTKSEQGSTTTGKPNLQKPPVKEELSKPSAPVPESSGTGNLSSEKSTARSSPEPEKGKSKVLYWVLGAVAVIAFILLILPSKNKSTKAEDSGTTNSEAVTPDVNNSGVGNSNTANPGNPATTENVDQNSNPTGNSPSTSTSKEIPPEAPPVGDVANNQEGLSNKPNNQPKTSTASAGSSSSQTSVPKGKVVYNFGYGLAAIVAGNDELNELVNLMKKNPSAKLTIVGYTDNTGLEKYNQILSEQRANSLFYYLINIGIDSKRMTTIGMADKNPLYDNTTEDGRRGNRRVEFIIE